ncbi:MAG: pantetheine-phosphate adenylyltransferase [Eubacterium sp.]|nr:pantetheine-phosphate adenylyltransferase [Candidatus Colimonas fimequi]
MATKALFTGSFDPLTNGHLNLIERASVIFDEVTVAIVVNFSKKSMFTLEERTEMIEETVAHLGNVKVDKCAGLLADYVNKNGFNVIIRGLRNGTDFDYELQMQQMNDWLLNDGIESVFLMTDPKYGFVSSSLMKEVLKLGGDIEGLVPDNILKRMNDKFAESK